MREELARAAEAVARDGTPREVSCRGEDDAGLVSLAGAFGKPHGLTVSVMPGEPGHFVVQFVRTGPGSPWLPTSASYFLGSGIGGGAGLARGAANGEPEAAAFGLSFFGFFGSRPLRF